MKREQKFWFGDTDHCVHALKRNLTINNTLALQFTHWKSVISLKLKVIIMSHVTKTIFQVITSRQRNAVIREIYCCKSSTVWLLKNCPKNVSKSYHIPDLAEKSRKRHCPCVLCTVAICVKTCISRFSNFLKGKKVKFISTVRIFWTQESVQSHMLRYFQAKAFDSVCCTHFFFMAQFLYCFLKK